MTFFEFIGILSLTLLLFAGYMAIGVIFIDHIEVSNNRLRVISAIFWPITILFCCAIIPIKWLCQLFNED